MHSRKISVTLFQGCFSWKTRQLLAKNMIFGVYMQRTNTHREMIIHRLMHGNFSRSISALTCKSKWTFPLILMRYVRKWGERHAHTDTEETRESCSDEMWRRREENLLNVKRYWSMTADDNEVKHRGKFTAQRFGFHHMAFRCKYELYLRCFSLNRLREM